jgi:hypothetical protein
MTPATRYRAACHALGLPVWRPGMRAVAARPEPLEPVCSRAPDDLRGWTPYPGAEPDLADPATVGCLLAAVREAWQAPYMHVVWMGNTPAGPSTSSWWSACIDCRVVGHGPTEADALIAALEAAAARRGGQP